MYPSPLLHCLSHSLLCCHPLPQAAWTRFEHQHVVKRNTREANSPEVQRKNQLNLDLVTVTESRIHDLLTLRYINNWMSTKTCFLIIIVISLGRILWVFGMISSHFSTAHTHCPSQSHTTVQDILPPCHKNNKHTLDNLRDKCPTIIPVFFTATAYRSWMLCGSLTHSSTSPAALYVQGSLECNNLFRTPQCYIDLSCGRIPELHLQMMLPFCRVKIFLAHPYDCKKFLHEFFSYEIFSTWIFCN